MSPLLLNVDSGAHDRRNCPVVFPVPESIPAGAAELITAAGERLHVQIDARHLASCVFPALPGGVRTSCKLTVSSPISDAPAVRVRADNDAISITLGEQLLTRYIYNSVPARPYFFPLLAPGQIPVTRSFPMETGVPGETQDHPHHRSLWVAFGEVNGADNWSEAAGHASTRPRRTPVVRSGTVQGGFTGESVWTAADGTDLLTEHLSVTAWNTGQDVRLLDFEIRLSADFADVHFGDTKEGGILSVRVASELDVPRTGVINNVYGGINEGETWGKASHWCDYSGTIAGRPVGISVMDHPDSFRYPTHWHVRNYGLMTANPFGYAAYTNRLKDGSHYLRKGESLFFRYRLMLHSGSCREADVNSRYLDFVAPPIVHISA